MRKVTWGQMWPQRGKIKILEKRLSTTAQNHYADLENTCRDKFAKVGVIVRYTKNVIGKKNEGWGQIWPRVAAWGLIRQQKEEKEKEKEEEERAGGRKQKFFCLIPEQWYHNEGT
jgi:hypothetical protein